MGGLAGDGVRADFVRKRASWPILYRGSVSRQRYAYVKGVGRGTAKRPR